MERAAGGAPNLDSLTEMAREWRARAGAPSYEALAKEVHRLRLARAANGKRPTAPSKATVYAAYQFGRQRLDLRLCLDLLSACGAQEPDLERFRAAYNRLTVLAPRPAELSPEISHAEPVVGPGAAPVSAATNGVAPTGGRLFFSGLYLPLKLRNLLLLAGLALNILGHMVVMGLGMPLYLDMVGTALVALSLGPWYGALVGLATNLAEIPFTGHSALPFALVNVTGALVWGYGVRFLGRTTVPRLMGLTLVVAFVSTFISVPIQILAFNGISASSTVNYIVEAYRQAHDTVWGAQFATNLSLSIVDKLVSLFVVIALLDSLSMIQLDQGVRPPKHDESNLTED